MPSKRKQNEARKAKKEGGEKVKSKSQDSCVTFKPKHYLKILLSAHARTSQTNNYFVSRSEGRAVYDL